jgi:hypothetical protein
VRIWDLKTCEEVASLFLPNSCAAISGDGTVALAGDGTGHLSLFDLVTD